MNSLSQDVCDRWRVTSGDNLIQSNRSDLDHLNFTKQTSARLNGLSFDKVKCAELINTLLWIDDNNFRILSGQLHQAEACNELSRIEKKHPCPLITCPTLFDLWIQFIAYPNVLGSQFELEKLSLYLFLATKLEST